MNDFDNNQNGRFEFKNGESDSAEQYEPDENEYVPETPTYESEPPVNQDYSASISNSESSGKSAMSDKERAKIEKASQKRDVMRARKMKSFEAEKIKHFADIDKAEEREKSKTDDPTKQREIELAAIKRREQAEAEFAQKKRVIMSSSGSISYERKKSLYGYGFIAIWIIGVIFIFISPLLKSIQYSLCDTDLVNRNNMEQYGMTRPGIHLEWNSFAHYDYAFNIDGDFTVNLVMSLGNLVPQVAMVLIFSLFIAVLLNQKFKGRTVMRAIFFFPVLIATGPVISIINGGLDLTGAAGGGQFSSMFQTDMVDDFLRFMGLYHVSTDFADFIGNVTSDIFNLLWKSGIQILIFLSALQQIPTSAKEAASMEGAT
ncbi:MAG: sugar ABC transporter permease, partial [Oscillospiraceae bacterium]|nr:sugar ABC transporter permease [Oscillospiraceae bacterium]